MVHPRKVRTFSKTPEPAGITPSPLSSGLEHGHVTVHKVMRHTSQMHLTKSITPESYFSTRYIDNNRFNSRDVYFNYFQLNNEERNTARRTYDTYIVHQTKTSLSFSLLTWALIFFFIGHISKDEARSFINFMPVNSHSALGRSVHTQELSKPPIGHSAVTSLMTSQLLLTLNTSTTRVLSSHILPSHSLFIGRP